MSDFVFTNNPSNNEVDAIRILIQDTDPEEPLLGNGAIQYMIDTWSKKGNAYYVAHHCARLIASRFAREVNTSSDSNSIGTSELQQKYLTLADDLLEASNSLNSGEIVWAAGCRTPPAFGIGMHDNWEAGQQDYGDWPEGTTGYNHNYSDYPNSW